MAGKRVPRGYWSKDRVIEESQKYQSIQEWRRAGGGSYGKAIEMGWLKEATRHMQVTHLNWSEDVLEGIAKKYDDISDFIQREKLAYIAIQRRGLLEKLTSHMARKIKPNGFWTKSKVLEDARQYSTIKEWSQNSTAISVAQKNGWYEEATSHMQRLIEQGKWTKEKVRLSASKFLTKVEWIKCEPVAYNKAVKSGWLAEVCDHMEPAVRLPKMWTKEKVLAEAKRYHTKNEFLKLSKGAADAAKRNGWYQEATSHMGVTYSFGELTLYKILLRHDVEFETQKRFEQIRDKYPLPFDFYLPKFNLVIEYHGDQHFIDGYRGKSGLEDRQKKDSIKKLGAKKIKINYLMIDAKDDLGIQKVLFKKLNQIANKTNISFNLVERELSSLELSRLKTLGRWSKEDVLADAKNYQAFNDWRKNSPAHQIARKHGWLDEAKQHMISEFDVRSKARLVWTKDKCMESAKSYKSRSEWKKSNPYAYASALKHEWLDEVCAHMGRLIYPNGYWTKEQVLKSALGFESRTKWMRACSRAYKLATEKGWLEDATKHMTVGKGWSKRIKRKDSVSS